MKVRYLFLLGIFLIASTNIFSQQEPPSFKPSGKVFGTSFLDYNTGFNSNSNISGFNLSRALIGYKYDFLENISARVSLDGAADRSTDNKVEVHVRNAYVSWTDYGFKVDVGLMNLKQFSTQQSFWGHRYALQSLQDLAGMGHAVDIGALATYNFSPILSADISITNGEGYKKIRKDKSMRYSVGTTLKALDHFTFRAYADIYTEDEDYFDKGEIGEAIRNQFTYSLFAGYKNNSLVAGAEFSKQLHNQFIKGNHITGVSVFSTLHLSSKWNVYARYDRYESSNSIGNQYGWYDDRQVVIAGIEFIPFNFLRLSPSFRNYNYAKSSSEQYLFISGEVKF